MRTFSKDLKKVGKIKWNAIWRSALIIKTPIFGVYDAYLNNPYIFAKTRV